MNNRITLGLLIAAIAAVGFYVWFDRDRPGTQASAFAERKLLPAAANRGKPATIDRIEITRPNEKLVLAMDKNRTWHVLSPMADRADPKVVRELVETLDTTLKLDVIPATPDVLERSGLRDAETRLTIFRGDAPPVELQLGAPTAVEGRVYARIGGDKDVMVIPAQIKTLSQRPADGYRDLRLFDFRAADVVRVTIHNPWGDFELTRDSGRWEMAKPVPARADDKAVNEWLERLCATEIQAFAPAEPGDLLSFGLMAPRGSVQLELESPADEPPRVVEFHIGRRADERYAHDATLVRLPGRGMVAAVPLVIEEALLLEPDALREHTLFSLNPDLVDRLRIHPAAGPEVLLARQGDNWTMLQPSAMAVEASEVTRLMRQLPGARVREFLTGEQSDAARTELESPTLRVTFASFSSENTAESAAGETPIATISFARPRPDESMLVRVDEDNVVVRVDADLLTRIPIDPLAWQPLALFPPGLEISTLGIQGAGPARAFERKGGTWKGVGDIAATAPASVQSAAALLVTLRAVRWAGSVQPSHGLDAPTLVVRASTAQFPIEIRIGKKTPEGLWPATITGRPGVFLLSDPDRQTLAAPAQ